MRICGGSRVLSMVMVKCSGWIQLKGTKCHKPFCVAEKAYGIVFKPLCKWIKLLVGGVQRPIDVLNTTLIYFDKLGAKKAD